MFFMLKYREYLFAKEECLPVFAACVYNSADSTACFLTFFPPSHTPLPPIPAIFPSILTFIVLLIGRIIEPQFVYEYGKFLTTNPGLFDLKHFIVISSSL